MNTIVVSAEELAEIFSCNGRTISKLAAAGIVIKIGAGKFNLITSTRNYIIHQRELAATHAARDGAATELALLRKAQRTAIEQKSNDFVKRTEVSEAWVIIANEIKSKLLELPLRLRQRIEDNHPTVFTTLKSAIAAEDDFDAVCCEILEEITELEVAPL